MRTVKVIDHLADGSTVETTCHDCAEAFSLLSTGRHFGFIDRSEVLIKDGDGVAFSVTSEGFTDITERR